MVKIQASIKSALEDLIQGDDEAKQQARILVSECAKHLHGLTVGAIVWREILSSLQDSEIIQDKHYLMALKKELEGEKLVPHRIYLLNNFLEDFTEQEAKIFQHVAQLLDQLGELLEDKSFAPEQLSDSILSQVEEYYEELRQMDETTPLYQVFLYEIITVLLSIALDDRDWRFFHHPIPKDGYLTICNQERRHTPDVTQVIKWAQEKCKVLRGEREAYITCYINIDTTLFVLH